MKVLGGVCLGGGRLTGPSPPHRRGCERAPTGLGTVGCSLEYVVLGDRGVWRVELATRRAVLVPQRGGEGCGSRRRDWGAGWGSRERGAREARPGTLCQPLRV